MNVLGICGSPHPKGNTAYALRRALAAVEEQGVETTYVSLADADGVHPREITPCDGCFACREGE